MADASEVLDEISKEEDDCAQAWIRQRLTPVNPIDLRANVHFFCTAKLQPPPQFEQHWTIFDSPGAFPHFTRDYIMRVDVFMIFVNGESEDEAVLLGQLLPLIADLGDDSPFVLLAPHTRRRLPRGTMAVGKLYKRYPDGRIDGVLISESEGFRFAMDVHCEVERMILQMRWLGERIEKKRQRIVKRNTYAENNHKTLWDFCRRRIVPSVPEVNYTMRRGMLKRLDGRIVGPRISGNGPGVGGYTFILSDLEGNFENTDRALKAFSKAHMRDILSLRAIKRHIDVMNTLSSEQWMHPNVSRLFQVLHSVTHIFFLVGHAGPDNLYRRLNQREKDAGPNRPQRDLPLDRCTSVLIQATTAVCHLHRGPQIAHRDIRPESFAIKDIPGEPVSVVLTEFETALAQSNGTRCRTLCGTVPFAAPEVMHNLQYCGLTADIWSLGVTIIEVLCKARIIETTLGLEVCKMGKPPDKVLTQQICQAFEVPGAARDLLAASVRPELQLLEPISRTLVEGAMHVDAQERWDATRLFSEAAGWTKLAEQLEQDARS